MMNIDKKKIVMSIIAVLFMMINMSQSNAEDNQIEQKEGYHVNLDFPENQNPEVSMYYDLKMSPDSEQDIFFTIVNDSNEDKTFNIIPKIAVTSDEGSLSYIEEGKGSLNPTLKYPFYELVDVPNEVTLAPKEKKQITATLKMPKEAFEGVILGALYISETDNLSLNSGEGAYVKSNIVYQVVFKLHEEDTKVDPDLQLNKASIGQVEGINHIFANMENIAPVIMNNVLVEAKVTKKGSDKVLYKGKKNNMQIAPNSFFNFPISIGTAPFEPGKYTMHVFASSKGGYEWKLSKDFTIDKDQASNFNQLSVITLDDVESSRWYLWVILIVLVLIILMIGLRIHNQKKSKQMKEAASLKRKKNT